MSPVRKLFVQTGQRFGRGVVTDPEIRLGFSRAKPYGVRGARMLCDCGTAYEAPLSQMMKGAIQSCGCQLREWARELAGQYGRTLGQPAAATASITHGMGAHPLYNTWHQMMLRCEDPRNKRYARYGGRGIKVCDRWRDVRRYIEDIERDLGPRPTGMTLDRINNDGDYEPGNMRWATDAEQSANRSRWVAREHTDGRPALDDIRKWPAMVSIPRASAALGFSRSHGYALAARGEFPVPVADAPGPRVIATADLIAAMSG